MFGVQIQQAASYIKNPYFNITLTYSGNQKLPNGTIVKTRIPMVLEPCTLDHWIQFKPQIQDIENSFAMNSLNDYLCPRLNETFPVQGQYLNDLFVYLKFAVVACKNKTFTPHDKWQYSCLSFADQQKVMKQENVRFRMIYPNYIVNAGNPSDILTGFLDQLYFSIQPQMMYTTADIYYTNHYVETDNSLLPIESVDQQKYQTLVGNYTTMAEFFVRADLFSMQTTRTFTKIDEFLSYIGGFAQVFLLISAVIVSFYNNLAYQVKLANKLYDFEFSSNKPKAPRRKKELPKSQVTKLSIGVNNDQNYDKEKQSEMQMQQSQQLVVFSNEQIEQERIMSPNSGNKHDDTQSNLRGMILPALKQKKQLVSVKFQNDESLQAQQYSQQQMVQNNNDQSQSEFANRFFPSPKTKGDVGNLTMADSKGQSLLDEIQSPIDSFRQQQSHNYSALRKLEDSLPMKLPPQGIPNQSGNVSYNQQAYVTKSTSNSQRLLNNQNEQAQQVQFKNKVKQLQVNTNLNDGATQKSNFSPQVKAPMKSTATSISRIIFQDKKSFLEQEVKDILKKAKRAKITLKFFLYQLTCRKLFADEQNLLISKATDRIEDDLDIFVLLTRLKDVEKIKEILFDKQQQILFNFFPKPVIKVNDTEEELPDKINLMKEIKQIEKKPKVKNNLKLKLSQIGMVMKAVQKFKQPLTRKITNYDNVDAYQKLYEAYEYVSYKNPKSLMNQKLINLLGHELKHVFETCKLIETKQDKINKELFESNKGNKTLNEFYDNGGGGSPIPEQFGSDNNCFMRDKQAYSFQLLNFGIKKQQSHHNSPRSSPQSENFKQEDEIMSNDTDRLGLQDKEMDSHSIYSGQIGSISRRIQSKEQGDIKTIKDIQTQQTLRAPQTDTLLSNPNIENKQ